MRAIHPIYLYGMAFALCSAKLLLIKSTIAHQRQIAIQVHATFSECDCDQIFF